MTRNGDSYRSILYYWAPELVSQTILLTLPTVIDSLIISQLSSTTIYGAVGVANNFLHTMTKLAESLQVAAIAVIGHYNGAQEYEKAGKSLGDIFWTTTLSGAFFAFILFSFSTQIYEWLNVPHQMAVAGSSFLKLRAIGIVFSFIYLAFIGFMKAVKNTKTPMVIFVCGQIIFIILDYALVLGKFGMPQLKLTGSAIATIVQNALMVSLSVIYILNNEEYKKYFKTVFYKSFSKAGIYKIINLSWQIAIDKTALSFAYIQLGKMIAPMGKYAIASYSIIQMLERLAFLPAIAFANVLTFLVSNNIGAKEPDRARANVKKILKLTSLFVALLLVIICLNPQFFIRVFDNKNKFTDLASEMFPIISLFVVFDFVQLILASALRGAGDVFSVMVIRAFTCFAIFTSIGWWLAGDPIWPLNLFTQGLNIESVSLKFIILYCFFYISNGIMGLFFIARLKTKKWKVSQAIAAN